ncbi:MAG: GDSL-type esterase/lipase family protein [Clostridium sp.]|uniref:GDSL-type esterase/lipase family protein n=1 Tax=Clostridium sp. TaxID=1506 RepID=UPI003D6C7CAE
MNYKKTSYILAGIIILLIVGGGIGAKIGISYITNKTNEASKVMKVESWEETNKTLKKRSIVFVGDSITEFFKVDEFFEDVTAINRGIVGDTTDELLARIKESVYDIKPSKAFLMIGTNDIVNGNRNPEYIVANIGRIIEGIKSNSPETKIYLESVYPVYSMKDKKFDTYMVGKRTNEIITEINGGLKVLAKSENITYIDVYSHLIGDNNQIKIDYTYDGLHLDAPGYIEVVKVLTPYVEN